MENKPPFEAHAQGMQVSNFAGTSLLPPRWQYSEDQYPEVSEESSGHRLHEYLQILRRQKGVLLLIVVLGFLVSVLVTIPQTPIYQARGSIEIQNINDNFLNARNVNTTSEDSTSSLPGSDLQTQAKILQSESLLELVAAKLDLGKKLFPEEGGSLSAWRKTLGLGEERQAATREKTLNLIAANLKISTDANTRLIEIRYDSTDPQLAADVVNTLTAELIEQNIESHWKTTQQTGDWLTHQMEDVRIKLEQSEDELQAYANASGLLFMSEKDNVAEEKLRQLQEELSKAQADRVTKQSKYELASKESPESLPDVLDDATLKEYQVKLTDLLRQRAELMSSLTASNPAVKKVQAQVTTLESALEVERNNIIQKIHNEFDSALRREHLLGATYAAQAHLMSDQSAKVTHYSILKHKVDMDRQLYDSMLQDVQAATMSSALRASNIRVIDSAEPPAHPYKPSLALNSAIGIFAGAFFGIAFVVVKQSADRTIQGPGDATVCLDMPELGAIPSVKAERSRLFAYDRNGKNLELKLETGGSSVELVTSNKNHPVMADSFRATLTSILYCAENGDRPHVIVITSANPGEGKTAIASNLALAVAEIGRSVLLIDGDLRKPRLHEIFGVPNRWGLTDLLEGKTPPSGSERMVFKTGFRNLSLLPSGSLTSNISGLLHSPRTLELLNRLRAEFEMVIIDTPPMLHMPDARILGRCSDGVILVVQSALTMRDAAVAASQQLTRDGTRVLGAVLNQWDPGKTISYAYGYGKGYSNRS